jgi:hypothetical protein
MSFLRALRGLVLGETWALPLGVAVVVATGAVLAGLTPSAWHDAGGPVLLAGVVAVLLACVSRGARG